MSIQIGKAILNYRILEKLGEGGMGVVYKAEDMKLDRIVALKFLPKHVAADEREQARFLQEAKAASALNHPNVCIIYDLKEDEGQQFIVMEFVDGVTIRQKIRERAIRESPLPIDDVLSYAIQIGEALKAAHGKGITHRDIKSDNVMVTATNLIKVMDFGLAKLKGALKLTKTSSTVGTLAYMSPEQIQGKETDARMDIFSFGVVLYEMLTGRLPFQAEYESALMYSILNTEPEPVTKHRPELSSGFVHLLDRALEKEPEDRYQTVNDMVIELRRLKRDTSRVSRKGIAEMPPAETAERPAEVVSVSPQKKIGRAIRESPLQYVGVSILVALLIVVSYLLWWGKRPPAVLEFTNTTQLTTAVGVEDYPTWSPDGRTIAYESSQSGNRDIWIKQAGGGPAVNLTEDYTGSDRYPSWSPDGNQIAFQSNRDGGDIFVMPTLGGVARKVVASQDYWSGLYLGPRPGPPQWSPDGTELAYAVVDTGGCFVEIVSLQRATFRRLRLPGPENDPFVGWELNWSPDGRYFAYGTAWDLGSPTSQVWVMQADDGVGFPVRHEETLDLSPQWSRDGNTLYFVSDRGGSFDLYQQRMGDDGTPMGSPQQLTFGLEMRYAKFSPDGNKLAYSKGRQVRNMWRVPNLDDRKAIWTDAQQLTFGQARLGTVRLSPIGKWFVYGRSWEGKRNVWVIPVEGGEPQRVMMDPMNQIQPRWSPDGREIAFHSEEAGKRNIWVVPFGGGPARQVTQPEAGGDYGPNWSPDGMEIVFVSERSGNWDIWIVPSQGGTARQLTRHAATDFGNAWSPDGREIVFYSDRSGNNDIWTIPARGGEARQLTDNPASDDNPRWSPDGQWIIFRSNRTGSNSLWRVPAEGGSTEPVTERGAGFGGWSKDGKKVYFSRGGNIREVPFMGGAERQLTDLAGKYGSLGSISAVDEQYIYFLWNENTGDIWVMDVEGNE